ncbi:MAG: GumC family protein [Asticcacaulis sp.]
MRPAYALSDMPSLLLREIWLMGLVFLLIAGLGFVASLKMPTSYTAEASLLVKMGQEYVYEPRAGDAARGAVPKIDEVVQSEVEILMSHELRHRVVKTLGFAVIAPKAAAKYAKADPVEQAKMEAEAAKAIQQGMDVATAPENNVVRLGFKHENRDSAALILNTLIDQYLLYRRDVFKDVTSPVLERQREAFELSLREADRSYEAFLLRNGVGDYATAKSTYAKLYDTLLSSRYELDAKGEELSARLATLNARLETIAPEINLQRDLDLSVGSKLLQLKADREQLLARYTPEADPVRQIDAQIQQLEAMVRSGKSVVEKDRRLGANPVYQELLTEKIRLEAEQSSNSSRRQQVIDQLGQVTGKLQSLNSIEAEFNALAAERDALQNNLRTFTTRAQESRASGEIAKAGDDSIRVVGKAVPPAKGKSLRKLVIIAGILFGGFTALCLGLLRAFLRPGFPTPRLAERTLDLPILAMAGRKAA